MVCHLHYKILREVTEPGLRGRGRERLLFAVCCCCLLPLRVYRLGGGRGGDLGGEGMLFTFFEGEGGGREGGGGEAVLAVAVAVAVTVMV